MPYLYFLKGGAIILSVDLSFIGLVQIGDGEYLNLLSEFELKVEENYLPSVLLVELKAA